MQAGSTEYQYPVASKWRVRVRVMSFRPVMLKALERQDLPCTYLAHMSWKALLSLVLLL